MRDVGLLWKNKRRSMMAVVLSAMTFISSGKEAIALTADDVLNKMNIEQRVSYIGGMLEGLATARWYKDRPNADGMDCIYDWYYQEPTADMWNSLITWFQRHPDKEAGALLYVLIKQECGE